MTTVVVGAGTMGAGIAQTCLEAGDAVKLIDPSERACLAATETIRRGLSRSAARRATSFDARAEVSADADEARRLDVDAAMARLQVQASALDPTSEAVVDAMGQASIVIEVVSEDARIKESVWTAIGAVAAPTALLATNTSSMSVSQIGTWAGRPADVCGVHFFNPAAVLPLVEVVRGEGTSESTLARATEWARHLGKTPIACRDRPGFIVNRLLIPYVNEAARLADEGWVDAKAIDEAMQLGARMPIGPLALADLIGLDVVLAVMDTLHAELGDARYASAPVLRRYVRAGRLGRKSGAGFHDYGGAT